MMTRPSVVLILALAGPLFGQATNDAFGALTVNGVTGSKTVLRGEDLIIEVTSQNPNVPFLLFSAPMLSVGEVVIPPIMVDVGPSAAITIIIDGLGAPTSFLDLFGNTGPGGRRTLTFNVDAALPLGTLAAMQALLVDPLSPAIAVDTAATEIVVDDLDFGTVAFARGASSFSLDALNLSFGGSLTDVPAPSSDFSFGRIALNPQRPRDWIFSSSTNQGRFPGRYLPPTPSTPQPQNDNEDVSGINTIHGRLFQFADNTVSPPEFGYMIVSQAVGPVELPGTRMTNGTSLVTPWENNVAINEDSSVMAAVVDVAGQPDEIYLIKLDGTTFPSTGTAVANITPASSPSLINETSIRMTNGVVYFVASAGSFLGTLFRAPQDGSVAATAVTLPPLGTGLSAMLVDDEMFVDGITGDLYIQAGDSPSEEDLFRLANITPAGESVMNLTSFAVPTELEEFGSSYTGVGVTFSLSPTCAFCCYVTRDGFDDELFVISTAGGGPAIPITDGSKFNPSQDDVIEVVLWSDSDVMFQIGPTISSTDVYNYNFGTGTLTNCTLTSGFDPTVSGLPVSATPGTIDSDGQLTFSDRIILARDNSPVATGGFNIIGIDFATLSAYDITGNEFSGGTAPNLDDLSNLDVDMTLSPFSSIAYFKGSTATHVGVDNEALFSVDLASGAPATMLTADLIGDRVEEIHPFNSGVSVAFAYVTGTSNNEEFAMANFGLPGVTTIPSPLSGNGRIFSDGSLIPLAAGASQGFVFVQGTGTSVTPTDAVLIGVSTTSNGAIVLDPTPGAYVILGISHP